LCVPFVGDAEAEADGVAVVSWANARLGTATPTANTPPAPAISHAFLRFDRVMTPPGAMGDKPITVVGQPVEGLW
jgi:hypothetical protein